MNETTAGAWMDPPRTQGQQMGAAIPGARLAGEQQIADPWRHRSAGMTCRTCMWFAHKAAERLDNPIGRCRRHAPTMSGYPVVYLTDWCGDHKLDENRI